MYMLTGMHTSIHILDYLFKCGYGHILILGAKVWFEILHVRTPALNTVPKTYVIFDILYVSHSHLLPHSRMQSLTCESYWRQQLQHRQNSLRGSGCWKGGGMVATWLRCCLTRCTSLEPFSGLVPKAMLTQPSRKGYLVIWASEPEVLTTVFPLYAVGTQNGVS